MLFIVVLLLGAGWSFLKPYLNDLEKKLLLGILTLQIVSNIAMVIIEETAQGAATWMYWVSKIFLQQFTKSQKQVLLWVDVICCCLVLPAIAWSIRNLKRAANTDGKALENAMRLSQFQQFYLVVIGYLYFTNIVVLFIKDALPYHLVWVPNMLSELVGLFLYCFTGFVYDEK